MNTIIIYGSRYGSTKRYAERLAEITGLKAVFFKEVKSVAGYDRIVYLGALCAGGGFAASLQVRNCLSRPSVSPTRPMPKTSTTSGAA